jgi:hypothetical protein
METLMSIVFYAVRRPHGAMPIRRRLQHRLNRRQWRSLASGSTAAMAMLLVAALVWTLWLLPLAIIAGAIAWCAEAYADRVRTVHVRADWSGYIDAAKVSQRKASEWAWFKFHHPDQAAMEERLMMSRIVHGLWSRDVQ